MLLVAAPSTMLSTAAHSAGGGCVSAFGVLLTGLIFGASTWTQLSRERSRGFLLCWVAVGQLLGHGLLELGCHGAQHHGAAPASLMLVLHGCAALLVALLLSHGERHVWSFARVIAALPARLRAVARRCAPADVRLPAVPAELLHAPAVPHRRQASLWCSPQPVRRGPPRLALSQA
ncbi:MAG: hypothetical protein QOE05_164 [Actinomycetota bacterium]|jgi:hypothetical protein|nr:hypothetical protein [Actinomycetota bacterium]